MNWSSRPPREVVARWSQLPVGHAEPEAGEPGRELAVARLALGIQRATAARRAARRRLAVGAGAVAAAAAIVIGVIALRPGHVPAEPAAFGHVLAVEGSVSVKRSGQANATRLSASSDALAPGDEVVTSIGAHTQLDLSSGVRLSLGEASRLQLPEEAGLAASAVAEREQVRLDAGTVQIKVPHLKPGRVFAVKTPDTEVTVHGTAFSVEVEPPVAGAQASARSITHVAVSEGIVSVRSDGREVFLKAGSQWTSALAEPATLPPKAPVRAEPEPTSSAVVQPSSVSSAHGATSSLAEQNQLLERAMSASRSGQHGVAVATLRELLRRYPSTRFAQEARVQLFRALAQSGDRSAASREARRYLQSYPEGFAREEARKLALD